MTGNSCETSQIQCIETARIRERKEEEEEKETTHRTYQHKERLLLVFSLPVLVQPIFTIYVKQHTRTHLVL